MRLALLVALCPILGLFGRFHWFLDLFNHLQAQYFVTLLLITLVLFIWRKPRHAFVALVALVIPTFHLAPLHQPQGASPDGPTLRVACFNVLSSSTHHANAAQWILNADPDFIFLPECNREWMNGLRPLDDTYPNSIDKIIPGNFGFSFLSKLPIVSQKIHLLGKLEIPLLEAAIQSPHGIVTVFGAHPVPPVSEFRASERDLYLAEMHRLSSATEGPAVILGDLNATRWSAIMQPTLRSFTDTQAGHGFSATWMRSNWLITIPIDHILMRGFSGTRSRTTGPDLGSDHRPVVAELAW